MDERTVLSVCAGYPGWLAVPPALEAIPGVRRLGEVRRADEALAVAKRKQPHAILVADEVEGRPSFPLLKALREAVPSTRLIIVALAVCSEEKRGLLLDLAITDYLVWSDLCSCDLLRLVLELIIVHGLVVNSPAPVAAYLEELRRKPNGIASDLPRGNADARHQLSAREREVLTLMAEYSNKEIADRLGVEVSTVNGYVRQIFTKLAVRKRSAAVLKAQLWRTALALGSLALSCPDQMMNWLG